MKKTIVKKTPEGTELEIVEVEDTEQQSSIKVAKNGKGEFSYEVKVYEDDPVTMDKRLGRYKEMAESHCR